MTECSTELHLTKACGKRVDADFGGGDLSSDGGFLLLRELENRYGYLSGFSSCITDPRDCSKVKHSQRDLLCQRVFQICAGYEDVNDSTELRRDSLLKLSCEVLPKDEKELASQPTLTRLENRVKLEDIKRLRSYMLDEYMKRLGNNCKKIILDIDGFADETHGSQQLSFFHGFYRHKMYYPFFITDTPSGFPVLLQLRPGNVHCGKQVNRLLRWLFWRLKRAFPKAEIILRGDGGFSLPEVIRICERSGVRYAFGFARNAVLERKNANLLEQARLKFCQTGEKARLFDDVYYMARSWSEPRRIIMKAEYMPQGTNQRFVITNMEDSPQDVYDKFYVLRGEHSENRIKELKLDIKADRLSCHQYIANQFRLFLHQVAYLFMLKLREAARGTKLQTARFSTLREKIIKVAVRVKQSVRRVCCQFSSSYPYRDIFTKIATTIATVT